MKRETIANIVATVAAVVIAVGIGSLLKKSQQNNTTKIERAINSTANAALEHGYICGAAQRDIEECRAELWIHGTKPVTVYGAR